MIEMPKNLGIVAPLSQRTSKHWIMSRYSCGSIFSYDLVTKSIHERKEFEYQKQLALIWRLDRVLIFFSFKEEKEGKVNVKLNKRTRKEKSKEKRNAREKKTSDALKKILLL